MPVGQAVHEAALVELEYWPAVQFVHVVASAVTVHEPPLDVPAGQVVQAVHVVAPAADQVLPAVQATHVLLAALHA